VHFFAVACCYVTRDVMHTIAKITRSHPEMVGDVGCDCDVEL